eukprot:CAMPEP_0119319850 /NCGR_PEP_ID=MMETSP1333-20130426/50509_1 /TAXON_ID=418940 /ORGANISM="Scyphosphaera apsteinii, Strain RCC1455" /LENGTH=417 /DNA_ID=CAMNT_0007326367 /DNA_START=21 /DNA_END=1274 /DNA_ORIENTATION=+
MAEEPGLADVVAEDLGEDEDDSGGETEEEMMTRIRQNLLMRGLKPKPTECRPPLLSSMDLAGVATYIRSGRCQNIIVMCGAGISVSAGIPDFRSPGTGLYDNLQKYDLPSPQSIFELSYFRERPDAFYRLAKELWPDNYAPTPTHHFIKLLHTKGLLKRCFSQNIDSLESAAGVPKDLVVAAHGNFDGCTCIENGDRVPLEEMRRAVQVGKDGEGGWLALAQKYGGLVKPDIVFFGEQLPERFFMLMQHDFPQCDLLIVMGTSLKVHPFASLTSRVADDVPRLLINREVVGGSDPMLEALGLQTPGAFDFSDTNYRDACYLGDCDAAVRELAQLLGWLPELEAAVSRPLTAVQPTLSALCSPQVVPAPINLPAMPSTMQQAAAPPSPQNAPTSVTHPSCSTAAADGFTMLDGKASPA